MNRDNSRRVRVVLILPILTLFLISLAYATSFPADLFARVFVQPSARIDCRPYTFNLRTRSGYVTCYIEIDGASVEDIDVSSVKLSISSKPGYYVYAEPRTRIRDYDEDGLPELKVKFNRTKIKEIIELPPISFGDQTLRIIGNVDEFQFEGLDTIRVIKIPIVTSGWRESKGTKIEVLEVQPRSLPFVFGGETLRFRIKVESQEFIHAADFMKMRVRHDSMIDCDFEQSKFDSEGYEIAREFLCEYEVPSDFKGIHYIRSISGSMCIVRILL